MSFTLDTDLAVALAALTGGNPPPPALEIGDWRAIRDGVAIGVSALGGLVPRHPEVTRTAYRVTVPDGAELDLRWFALEGRNPGSAVVHAHGGGMVAGSVDLVDPWIAEYVAASGVPFLSVEYRLAPEARDTTPAEDVYAALTWLMNHGDQFAVEPARIALFGESAGAGLAAGAAILARDHGIPVARQILVYPMLDDRTATPDHQLVATATWTYGENQTGWGALLGDQVGGDAVSPVAAPGRLLDVAGLAPAYIEVGELDIFRAEAVRYAQRLWDAGVSTELHVHPGVVHIFDLTAPNADVTRRAKADRVRVLKSL